jgi:hypothetical protein
MNWLAHTQPACLRLVIWRLQLGNANSGALETNNPSMLVFFVFKDNIQKLHTANIISENFPGPGATKNKNYYKITCNKQKLHTVETEEINILMQNIHRICIESNAATTNWNELTEHVQNIVNMNINIVATKTLIMILTITIKKYKLYLICI